LWIGEADDLGFWDQHPLAGGDLRHPGDLAGIDPAAE